MLGVMAVFVVGGVVIVVMVFMVNIILPTTTNTKR